MQQLWKENFRIFGLGYLCNSAPIGAILLAFKFAFPMRFYSSSFSSSAMQPWQHLSGLLLSGQSSDKSVGQMVMQSHFDLSGGQTNFSGTIFFKFYDVSLCNVY
jgi:hypothetical protein